MINAVLLYVGSAVITLWGIAHIAPTKSVVGGFGVRQVTLARYEDFLQ